MLGSDIQQNGWNDSDSAGGVPQLRHQTESDSPSRTAIKQAPIIGQPLTEQDKSDATWMEEARTGSVTTLNDMLRQFAGLSTVLFGLLMAFFDKAKMPGWAVAIGGLLLLSTLATSLYGSLPPTFLLVPILERIREQRQQIYRFKLRWYKWSSRLLFAALSVFFIGTLCALFTGGKSAEPPIPIINVTVTPKDK